ncbi:GNAT family N-acetyltransferase [Chelatococcus daeguensis]|uniref:Acetyltransferase (GNAT) domain n=1 Tax=Chelatococcus sambhunathii TaxID=363953 RepID=A0ABP2ABT4_9HYPH|nr:MULTISPECIES: GNAT family N-acetyltransferase [Chelatococcus]KZE36296.1 GCN5 family acetyltransferase [Chelatococcus daeguensis]MBM3084225.1 GNAT family N-acetyltransferase [Chelatococcus daeguensis]CUA89546.1 Acetyltransferase (GNAT) domain [Chelatococcus sambhunathii]
MLCDGYTDIPAGKLATVVTYLEMTAPPAVGRMGSVDLSLLRLDAPDVEHYLGLFRTVGGPWLWVSRLAMPIPEVARILADPDVEAYAVVLAGEDAGLLELDFRGGDEAEIVYFGLVEAAVGRGAGRALMQLALARAWSRPIRRLMVHTCHLDHPGALPFYVRMGFRPYKRAVEVMEDPRLAGLLPPEAAPHVPLIAPPR